MFDSHTPLIQEPLESLSLETEVYIPTSSRLYKWHGCLLLGGYQPSFYAQELLHKTLSVTFTRYI